MNKLISALLIIYLTPLLFGQEIVEKIEIVGNEKVTRETILFYLTSKEGAGYDENLLKKDFRVLWSTGFFSNIRMEREQGDNGVIVRIIVEENPIIKEIVYKTGKKLKENDIVNKLKEKDQNILPYSYYNPSKIQRIKQTINDLLSEKNLAGGEINTALDKKGKNELKIIFRIKEGSIIKVADIVFEGSPKLQTGELLGAMKSNKKQGFLSWITGKDTFNENKLSEDLSNLKRKLQEKGYMEASIGEPRIMEATKRSIFLKKKKMKIIVIPIQAGERYHVGDVKIEGNKIISSKYLQSLIKLKKGDIYSTKLREKAGEKIGEIYRNIGYVYAQVIPTENLDPKGGRVNTTFNISEGEVAYVNRLEFKGNTHTKDKAMRREFLLREGDRFSIELLKNSLLGLKQLGLVEIEKDPDIKPSPGDPSKMDVTVNVKELQKSNIQFSTGYSGYEGTFVSLSYSTVNLLGTGESMEVMAQYGKRIKNYMFGFTEPYCFDLPISLGFNVSDRYVYYPNLYTQQSRGINYNIGFRIRGWWRTSLTYGFEYIDVGKADTDASDDTSSYYPYYYGGSYGYGKYFVGSLSPTIYRSTVDSPLTPSRGTMYLVGCKISGGILGGQVNLFKPRFEWTFYHPIFRKSVIGLHLEYQFVRPYGGDSVVPFWERFYLGGERSIRGYEIYTIGPRTSAGKLSGGEKSLIFNAEYIIPVGGPLYAIMFCDLGNAYARDENVSLKNLYSSTGLELRIFVPALRVPFRLILAFNSPKIDLNQSSFAFRFAVGTSF